MADISLSMSGLSVTCVSNAFIDNFMGQATGEYVKIYIYLLRCLEQEGEAFSIHKIAAKLGHTDLDVKRAFDYWEQQGMIRQERDVYGELTGICVLDPLTQGFSCTAPLSQQRPITISAAPTPVIMPTPEAPSVMRMSPEVMPDVRVPAAERRTIHDASYYDDDEAFSELLFMTETYLGHPLSSKDVDRILFWYDGLNMPADLVEYLITYCVDKGHNSLAYMNKIALSWADSGITTVEEAKSETSRHSEVYYAVCQGFGISGRSLAPAELKFIKSWESMFSDTGLIREACSRTILRTGKSSFGYADKILTDWHEHGIETLSDVESYDRNFAEISKKRQPAGHRMPAKSAAHNFSEREYENWEELEAKLLARK